MLVKKENDLEIKYHNRFKNPVKHLIQIFCENSERLKAITAKRQQIVLTHFRQVSHFYTPENVREPKVSRGTEM